MSVLMMFYVMSYLLSQLSIHKSCGRGVHVMDILLFLGQSLFYDALILSSVSWVIKKKVPITRFVTAIGASLIASFIIFLVAPVFLLLVPVLIVKIAFVPQTLKGYGVAVLYFYTFSAFLSGVLHILRYFINFDDMPMGWFLVFTVLIAVVIAVFFMFKSQFLKNVYTLGDLEHYVTLYYGDMVATGIGFVDTGNTLVDQVTQLPVMIVPRQKVEPINARIENGSIPTWELNISVVGDDEQRLLAFRPTLLLIDDMIVKDVIVGLCETNFVNYDFLLQPEITVGRGVF